MGFWASLWTLLKPVVRDGVTAIVHEKLTPKDRPAVGKNEKP